MEFYKAKLVMAMIGHLAVDGVCVASLYLATSDLALAALSVIIYDVIAFALQPVLGVFRDLSGKSIWFLVTGLTIAGVAGLLPLGAALAAVVLGIANSIAHIGGIGITVSGANNRFTPLGLYVSTGSIGVGMATVWPGSYVYLAVLALGVAGGFVAIRLHGVTDAVVISDHERENTFAVKSLWLGLVGAVVFARGLAGSLIAPEFALSLELVFFSFVAVFLGKALGGIVADRIGVIWAALLGLLPSVFGLVLFPDSMVLYFLSLCLFNFTMPITLGLAIRSVKGLPAFAFGLTAALLFAGTFVGSALEQGEMVQKMIVTGIILLSALAIANVAFRQKQHIHNDTVTEEDANVS